MELLEHEIVPQHHDENEIFLCEGCGWWSYSGEVQEEREGITMCEECIEGATEEDEDE